jgi:hypothetical protein
MFERIFCRPLVLALQRYYKFLNCANILKKNFSLVTYIGLLRSFLARNDGKKNHRHYVSVFFYYGIK